MHACDRAYSLFFVMMMMVAMMRERSLVNAVHTWIAMLHAAVYCEPHTTILSEAFRKTRSEVRGS